MRRSPFFIIFLLAVLAAIHADDPPVEVASKAELQRLNELIGGWRGTGQPRRGSNSGAWQETGEFVWDFQGQSPAIRYLVTNGKLMKQGEITWNATDRVLMLKLSTADMTVREYQGQWQDKQLVFTSSADAAGDVHRLTITPLNDKRTLVLHEKRKETGTTFNRVAEIGYTREGTRLAASGSGQPECIVTGGLGTMTVSYQGKTYYVCCSGCKQAFESDPAGIIAEAAARAKQEKSKTNKP